MDPVLLEVCCGSLDDALEAQSGGAARVELNSSMFLGGLTPSLGTVQEARARLDIPVMVMIRPRGGGFCYTEAEFAAMKRDAHLAVENGADGIVMGILLPDGSLDQARCAELMACAGDKDVVFHRAVDVVPDPLATLDRLVDLGVSRVLTSGQEPTVAAGVTMIRRMVEHAAGRIGILPGGGMEPWQVLDIVQQTGVNQVHIAPFTSRDDPSCRRRPRVTFGGALYPPEDRYELIDRDAVRWTRSALDTDR